MSDPVKQVIVTSQREITSGHGSHGDWTMYAVEATLPDGTPIVEMLNTFEVLPQGEPIDVFVKRRDSERYGVQYTLKPVREGSRADGNERRIAALESDVEELQKWRRNMEARARGI